MPNVAYKLYLDALATGENVDAASEELFRIFRRMSKGMVWMMFHQQDPQLVQDIVTKAFMGLREFRGEANFQTWFWRLAYNECLMEIRRRKTRREVYLEDLHYAQNIPEPLGNPSKQLFRDLAEVLSPEDNQLVQLRLEGYTYAEIASRLGKTWDEVNAGWWRCKKHIKEFLS